MKKSSAQIIKFGKEEIDISKLSDDELIELYNKMTKKKISLLSKIKKINESEGFFSDSDMSKMIKNIM